MSLRLSRLLERRAGDRRRGDRRNALTGLFEEERRSEVDRRTQSRRDEPAPEVWAGLNAYQLATLATFVATSMFLFWFTAQRFVVSGDEGTVLDGARRLLAGQALYRDFFTPMAPGSYWLGAIVLKIFGVTLAASRITTILDLSALAACICWLVSYRVNEWYGAWVAVVFVLLGSADPALLLPNQRWDSAAFATVALTIVASGGRPAYVFLAGALAAFAVWSTASFGLVILAMGTVLWFRNPGRFWPFLYGACALSVACLTVLSLQDSLIPMLNQLSISLHSAGSSYASYGSRSGGYTDLLANANGWKLIVGALITLGLILPAVLPIVVAALFLSNRKTLSIQLLFLGAIAILATNFPRFDVEHLIYSAPIFYALGAIFLAGLPWKPVQEAALYAATGLTLVLCFYGLWNHTKLDTVVTPVGTVNASADDAAFLRRLQEEIPTGSRTFVFPDLPIAYFMTLGENPTHYSYLRPGRVGLQDEITALDELRINPPKRIIYSDLPEWRVVKLWPGGDPLRLRMGLIENYLATNYHSISTIPYSGGNVQILEPRPVAVPRPTQQTSIAAPGRR
ncbi:MAG: hypothetical protein ABI824_07630 [Acidobacteriota bacterium]